MQSPTPSGQAVARVEDCGPKAEEGAANINPIAVKTVLLVEDEASLRKLLARVLRKYGYNVLEAEVPEDAHEIWKAKGAEIDLLVTDIFMPGGESGWLLARHFISDRSSLKMLFMSGYFGELPEEPAVTEANLIRKPFLPAELIAKVRGLLN